MKDNHKYWLEFWVQLEAERPQLPLCPKDSRPFAHRVRTLLKQLFEFQEVSEQRCTSNIREVEDDLQKILRSTRQKPEEQVRAFHKGRHSIFEIFYPLLPLRNAFMN